MVVTSGSKGNVLTDGNKGSNFPFQIKMLQGLECINNSILTMLQPDHELRVTNYKANKNGVGYSTNDFISRTDIIFVPTGVIISTLWFNETTGLTIAAPPIADLDPYIPPSSVTVSNLPAALGQQLMAGSLSVTIASNQTTLNVSLPTVVRTPTYFQAVAAGTVLAGARSVSVYNSGTTAGVWLGTPIAPGVQLSFSAGGQNDTLGAFAYTASATATLEITVIV